MPREAPDTLSHSEQKVLADALMSDLLEATISADKVLRALWARGWLECRYAASGQLLGYSLSARGRKRLNDFEPAQWRKSLS